MYSRALELTIAVIAVLEDLGTICRILPRRDSGKELESFRKRSLYHVPALRTDIWYLNVGLQTPTIDSLHAESEK